MFFMSDRIEPVPASLRLAREDECAVAEISFLPER